VIPKFDTDRKGYLSYDEFRKMIRSLGAPLTELQIEDVIRGVDVDGDGCIDMKELQEVLILIYPSSALSTIYFFP
jgi:Ca2+-binding EF-hand superfamily protein